jgi:hypothetical protein
MPTTKESRFHKIYLAVIFFAIGYAILLSIGLSRMSMQWDEVNHLNGGLLLIRGELWQYALLNSFYPPAFNIVTAAYFALAGASLYVGRLVAVTFSALGVIVVFHLAKEMYGSKTACLSVLLFAVMPGIVALSRVAMIETMLIFMFSLSMLFLFRWLQNHKERDKILTIATFAIGVAVKYQTIAVIPIVAIMSIFLLRKSSYMKATISQFVHSKKVYLGIILTASVALAIYELYSLGFLSDWMYAIQEGNAAQSFYSTRFPTPIFYLIEMTWPYNDTHPISPILYVLSLIGVGLLAYRRKPQDKFILVWLFTVYVVFTLIPNKQWRYITMLFPALAISAAELLATAYGKARKIWQTAKHSPNRKRLTRMATALLIVFLATGVFYSSVDAYNWATRNQTPLQLEEATTRINHTLNGVGSVAVLCPQNSLNNDMVWFYLNNKKQSQINVWQYPGLAVDTFTPQFNATELINLCQKNNTKTLILYEGQQTTKYFNSNLTEQIVYNALQDSGRFNLSAIFGTKPNRIIILDFK